MTDEYLDEKMKELQKQTGFDVKPLPESKQYLITGFRGIQQFLYISAKDCSTHERYRFEVAVVRRLHSTLYDNPAPLTYRDSIRWQQDGVHLNRNELDVFEFTTPCEMVEYLYQLDAKFYFQVAKRDRLMRKLILDYLSPERMRYRLTYGPWYDIDM